MASSRTGIQPLYKETQPLVDRVTQAVRQSIVDGRLHPGESVSINELATDLGVSHSPVREALQRLAAQGLIQLRPARTAIVAPLDLDDLHDIYRIRKFVEVDAAERGAPDLTDEDLQELEEQFELMCQGDNDTDDFWRHHDEFHRILLRRAASERLTQLISHLWKSSERYIRVVYSDKLLQNDADQRHRPILEIAKDRDGAAMAVALRAHFEQSESMLTTKLSEILAQQP